MHVAYFTAGTHGAGHVVRGLALRRAVERLGRGDARVSLVCPESVFQQRLAPDAHTFAGEVDLWRDATRADESRLARVLRDLAPDLIVVDLFWVPIALMTLPAPTWLLLRSVPGVWLRGPREAPFDATRHARIIAIEPAPGLEAFEPLPPIVYEDPAIVGSRDVLADLADLAGARGDEALEVVAVAGVAEDRDRVDAVAGGTAKQVRFDLSADPEPLFPLSHNLRHLGPADRLVACAGYNSFWEAQYFGYGDRVSWVAGQRVIDDQRWRASLRPERPRANGADVLARAVAAG